MLSKNRRGIRTKKLVVATALATMVGQNGCELDGSIYGIRQ